MNTFYLLILITFLGYQGPQKPAHDDCKKILMEAYDKISDPGNTNDIKKQYLSYRTTNYYRVPGENKLRSNAVSTQVSVQGQQVHVLNPEMEIVQDKKLTVTVLRNKKQIFISQVPTDVAISSNQLKAIRNHVLEKADVTGCQVLEGESLKLISMQLTEKSFESFPISSMKFWVSEKQKEVKKFEQIYKPGHNIERLLVEFTSPEKGATGENTKIFKNPADLVYDANGKLLLAYKGFEVIDTRQLK
jgi:hypothetical protein